MGATETSLSFNTNKTSHIHFCRFQNCNHASFRLDNQLVKRFEAIKILGLIFVKILRWSSHIHNLNFKNQSNLNLIKILSHQEWGANRDMLLMIIKSIMFGLLDYGAQVYGKNPQSELKALNATYTQP